MQSAMVPTEIKDSPHQLAQVAAATVPQTLDRVQQESPVLQQAMEQLQLQQQQMLQQQQLIQQQQQQALLSQLVREELSKAQPQHQPQQAPMQLIINNHSEANSTQNSTTAAAPAPEALREASP